MMEIRCCCNPVKLLGTVPVDHKGGKTILFFGPPGEIIELDVAMYWPTNFMLYGRGRPYPALKSMDLPIETLRTIPGFVENKDE